MAAPLCVLLAVLLVYPVGQLLWLSLYNDAGRFGLQQFRRLFASPVYVDVLLITLKISCWTTFFAVLGGYPVAYLIASLDKARKTRLLFWILLSFWTSFLVRTFAWIIILGRNGVLNRMLVSLGILDAPASLLFHLGSVLTGMVHALMPLAILTMLSVMENIDRDLPRAAATLGARPGSVFWKVYFPQSFPGVAAAALMVFVTAIGFFITPALLGSPHQTMITQIIIDQIQQTLDWKFAGAISVLLLAVVLLVFAAYDRLVGLSTVAGGQDAAHRGADRGGLRRAGDAALSALAWLTDAALRLRPRLRSAGRRRAAKPEGPPRTLWWIAAAVILFLNLPTFLMIPISFGANSGLNWPPHGFSLQWYREMFQSPVWMQAILRSLIVGAGTGLLAMAIGTPAALLLARGGLRARSVWLGAVLSPLIVPRMVIAVGLFYFYSRVGLVGTSVGLILGHTLIAVPYVVITMMAVLRNYDVRLDLAAQSLGARPWPTLRHITLPILAAGLMSSFLFAFATSFDELTIALFSTGGLTATLPKQFWNEVTLEVSPVIAAVSTCLFVFISMLIFMADKLRRKSAT